MENSVSITPGVVRILREHLGEFDRLSAARAAVDFDSPTWPGEVSRIESQIVTWAYEVAGALSATVGASN